MTVSLKSNFFANSRGLTFEDSATVTWTFDQTTNQLSATGSGGGGGGVTSIASSGGGIVFSGSTGAVNAAPVNQESAGWNSTTAIIVANTVPQDLVVPFACTLREVIIITQGAAGSSISGSCTVDLAHCSFATFPSSLTDMTGGTPPAVVGSSSPYINAILSGWTTSLAQNDIIRCTLASNNGFASVKIILRMY